MTVTTTTTIQMRDVLSAKIEYQMVIEPDTAAQDAGLRTRHFTYAKPSYEKAVKGVMDFLKQRDSGRFEKTWMMSATVYIEEREVSKWQRIKMTDASEDAAMISRPAS